LKITSLLGWAIPLLLSYEERQIVHVAHEELFKSFWDPSICVSILRENHNNQHTRNH